MTFRYRQKTGVADTTCVVMLCMATTMLLGFSNPKQSQGAPESSSAQPVLTHIAPMLVGPAARSPFVNLVLDTPLPARRPVSLAGQQALDSVLGGIDSRTWLVPSATTLDLAIAGKKAPTVGKFRGVGFPDIRTYDRAKRSPFDAPGPWAPLVVW